jgi:hypothetical protein
MGWGIWLGYPENFQLDTPVAMAILTEMRVRGAKPAEKPYKLFDERGLSCWSRPLADGCGAFDIG